VSRVDEEVDSRQLKVEREEKTKKDSPQRRRGHRVNAERTEDGHGVPCPYRVATDYVAKVNEVES
jgi:hypothetical protein